MFDAFRKERCSVHLYGKLPIAKDYLRVGCGQDAPAAWREWLDRTFSPAGEFEARILPFAMRFVFDVENHSPIMGLAWPSSDAGGLRKFPFSLLIERRGRVLLKDTLAGFVESAHVWDRLAAQLEKTAVSSTGESYLTSIRGETIGFEKGQSAPLEAVDLEAWIDTLWWENGRDGLFEVLERLSSLASQRYRGPIRLPLVADLPKRVQVHAWLRCLFELGVVEEDTLPTLFFPDAAERLDVEIDKDSAPHFLVVFRDAPTPDDWQWLTRADGVPVGEGDLIERGAKLAGGLAASENVPPLADSMRGIITRFKARSGAG